ncbi:MAG: 16S rRNA (uracil(1498)-N(3))-methyltransferase [Alphaproteobacteria bacterium]|nr:16S rRNA (uracil(1498)-N(3))-methyltransferase [Alphaproteobacteria bacterium]
MAIHDCSAQRLYVEAPLSHGASVPCSKDQAHYLLSVLRAGAGATALVFNGSDGEWQATIEVTGKRACTLVIGDQVRLQDQGPDVVLLFAPLKRARLDYMVQKAAELGVRELRPVLTERTVPDRVNISRMRANAIEAAEQCGILYVPDVFEPERLNSVVASWEPTRPLLFCDEGKAQENPLGVLQQLTAGQPVAVLIGPEGGFSHAERELLNTQSFIRSLSLGPRIMRADTAATAVLALVNAVLGDWQSS